MKNTPMTLEEAIEYVKTLTEDQQRVFEIGTVCGRSIQAQSSVDRAVNAMDDSALLQQALEKLEFFAHMKGVSEDTRRLITALRGRLAQPEQESVKFNCTVVDDDHPEGVPLSQWGRQPLTEAAIRGMCERVPDYDISTHDLIEFARAIERAHGITGATP